MNPSWTSAHVQPGLIKPPRRALETRPLVSIQISLVMAAVLAEPTGSVLVAAPPAHPAAATSPQLLVVHCLGNLRLPGPWDDDPFGPISALVWTRVSADLVPVQRRRRPPAPELLFSAYGLINLAERGCGSVSASIC